MATEGLKNIVDTFDRLKSAGQLRVMRSAANASLTPVVKALRQAAPKGSEAHRTYKGRTVAPGFLSRSIVKSSRIARDRSRVFAHVRLASEAWYGSLIEHGYRPGRRSGAIRAESRKGSLSNQRLSELGDKRSVKIAPKPWFFDTVARLSDEVLDSYDDKMGKSIMREWLK
jgi:hypothetical protein